MFAASFVRPDLRNRALGPRGNKDAVSLRVFSQLLENSVEVLLDAKNDVVLDVELLDYEYDMDHIDELLHKVL